MSEEFPDAIPLDPAIDYGTHFLIKFPVEEGDTEFLNVLDELNFIEVKMTESLLTPGLQTSILIQNTTNPLKRKDLDLFYNRECLIGVDRPLLALMCETDEKVWKSGFKTAQRVYRLDKREKINETLEQFTIHLCDPSLLTDAQTYQRKQWDCKTPSQIAEDCFTGCLKLNSDQFITESAGPQRDFHAENIHPFKTIQKQTEIADVSESDFSFVHYMTYQRTDLNNKDNDTPTHHFRSLTKLAQQDPTYEFNRRPQGNSRLSQQPDNIIEYSFPCDFDLLSDILNGYDEEGNIRNPVMTHNAINSETTLHGTDTTPGECNGTPFISWTNSGFEDDTESCPITVEAWAPRRKARISLLDNDKLALRLTINWNPMMNVGRTIRVNFPWIEGSVAGELQYYSGKYLIAHMTHYVKTGGLGYTTMDLVSDSVALGRTKNV